jgi:hypothetical protein
MGQGPGPNSSDTTFDALAPNARRGASGEFSKASGSSELNGNNGFVSSSLCRSRRGIALVTERVMFIPPT